MTVAPRVTVVVCAYTTDRWEEMSLAIERSSADPVPHESILVIDHNEELYRRASAQWPGLSVIRNEGPRGLSGARNSALCAVRTPLVAFLDDDAYPQDRWLTELLRPFDDAAVVASGGRALPVWPTSQRPAWLPEELWWIVGCSFRGQPDAPEGVRNVMGCNMAFRTADLVAIGGFNTAMGRVGTHPVGGEETEACILLGQRAQGVKIAFSRDACVRHHVSPDRTRFAYMLRRSYCEGLSKAALAGGEASGQALSTESVYAARVLPAAVLRELRHPTRGGGLAALGIVCSLGAAAFGFVRAKLAATGAPATSRPAIIAVGGALP